MVRIFLSAISCLSVCRVIIRENGNAAEKDGTVFGNILYGFRPSVIKAFPILYITLLAFAVFGISIQIFMPYLIIYYEVSLGMENYVLIMAPAIILAALFTAFYGKLYDKKGFKTTVLLAVALLISGYALLYLFRNQGKRSKLLQAVHIWDIRHRTRSFRPIRLRLHIRR